MCLFNFPNKSSIKARLKGLEEFECGHCPECLQKKSRVWALRASMEAKYSPGMMITLTYDSYKIDEKTGKFSNIENPIDPTIQLSKTDCQKFIKRLRKHFPSNKIKYILTAERGKRGRAHYHALIFGLKFDDLIRYKMSDRGNIIYKSKTLEKIWNKGICTVDSINLSAKIARYCTKYCSKDSGAEETFMLFSRGIGERALLEKFNGISYWIDGREYSIPKQIWNKVIEKRYFMKGYSKYVNRVHVEDEEKRLYNTLARMEARQEKQEQLYSYKIFQYEEKLRKFYNSRPTYFRKQSSLDRFNERERKIKSKPPYLYKPVMTKKQLDLYVSRVFYRSSRRLAASEAWYNISKEKRDKFMLFRDCDPQYQKYLEYWHRKAEVYDLTRPDVYSRILALPDNKYRSYKNKAIRAKHRQVKRLDFVPPRSNTQAFLRNPVKKVYVEKSFAPLPCHYWANDTTAKAVNAYKREKFKLLRQDMEKNAVDLDLYNNPFADSFKIKSPDLIRWLDKCALQLRATRSE